MFDKKFITILSIIIGVIVVAGIAVVLVGQKYEIITSPTANNTNISQEIESKNSEAGVITNEIDTSDWLTYRNEELGFSFRYPEDWSFIETDDKIIKFFPPGKDLSYEYNGDIVVSVENPNGLDIKSFYNGKDRNNLFTEAEDGYEELIIAGAKATKFRNVCCMFPNNQIVVIEFKDKFLSFTAINSFEIYNKIIETVYFY